METSSGKSGRKGVMWLVLAVAAVAALVLGRMLTAPETSGGRGGASGGGKGGGAGGKSGGGRTLEVSVQVLAPETVARTLRSSGTVMAREEVDLKSETEGRVTAVKFQEGRPAKKGDLLVQVDDSELRAEHRKLSHQIKLAEEREYRQRVLLEKQAVSQEEYDVALQEKNSLLAERDLLGARLAKTGVRAPFDGVVGLKAVSVGSYVTPGTRIAGFFSVHPLQIDFSIPEQYFSRVRRGDSLRVGVEGVQGTVGGVVHAVEPRVDPATRMLRIRAHIANEKGLIPPGASARVELPLEPTAGALMAPSAAVLPDIRGHKVLLLKGGKAREVPVVAGYRTEDRVQIEGEGVAAGDTLITSGLVQLKDGSPVKAARAEVRGGGRTAESGPGGSGASGGGAP